MTMSQRGSAVAGIGTNKVMGRRVVAIIIDSVLFGIVFGIVAAVTGLLPTDPTGFQPGRFFGFIALSYVLLFLYFIVLEGAWHGYTVGKRMLGIQVVSETGTLTWGQVIIRNVLRIVDVLPTLYILGFIIAIANDDRKRIGDFAAKTQVLGT